MLKVVPILGSFICFFMAASVYANTGEVTFNGSIIEEYYCLTTQINHQVKLDCSTNNSGLSEADIVSHSQLAYLDKDKKSAVMSITYY